MTNEEQAKYQHEADQRKITEQERQIQALQAKITQFAGMLLEYETKFDLIAENEAKRMIEFGETVRDALIDSDDYDVVLNKYRAAHVSVPVTTIQSIDIKQLYTNFKKP